MQQPNSHSAHLVLQATDILAPVMCFPKEPSPCFIRCSRSISRVSVRLKSFGWAQAFSIQYRRRRESCCNPAEAPQITISPVLLLLHWTCGSVGGKRGRGSWCPSDVFVNCGKHELRTGAAGPSVANEDWPCRSYASPHLATPTECSRRQQRRISAWDRYS